jgi:hypothetical protein
MKRSEIPRSVRWRLSSWVRKLMAATRTPRNPKIPQDTPSMFLLLWEWISNKHALINQSTFWEPTYASFLNIFWKDSPWINRSCPAPWIGMMIQQHVGKIQKWKTRNVTWCFELCTDAS